MLWRPPRRSWCMHRILCTACNRNSTRSFERGHDGNILEEAYRGRYARQRLLNFWPESSCGYHAIKRFVCIIQVTQSLPAPTDYKPGKPHRKARRFQRQQPRPKPAAPSFPFLRFKNVMTKNTSTKNETCPCRRTAYTVNEAVAHRTRTESSSLPRFKAEES